MSAGTASERLIVALNLGGQIAATWRCRTGRSDCRLLLSTVADDDAGGGRRPAAARERRRDPGARLTRRERTRVRIAMLAPISWRTPPRHYGPWELVTSLLTEALVARGVDVTLFATQDSLTAGKLAGVCPAPYSEDPAIDAKVWEMLHVAHVFERAGEFDLIHNQADFVPLAFSRLVETPMVTTIHGFSSERILPAFKALRGSRPLCRDQRRRSPSRPALCRDDPSRHPRSRIFRSTRVGSDDLLFFGRIHPDKGAAEAIAAAARAGRRLIMAGIVQDQDYHEREVAPALDGAHVVYRGPVGGAARAQRAGLGARAAPPHQLRRAVRTVGDRGAGLRHAGDRLQPRIDARTDRPWRDRLPGRQRR